MAILRTKEIEKLNHGEIYSKLAELKKELIKIKSQSVTGSQKIGNVSEIKRTIARILTIQNRGGQKTKE